MITALVTIQPAAPVVLTDTERAELDAWHAERDAEAAGDDHAFDLWLSGELSRLWEAINRLELQLESKRF